MEDVRSAYERLRPDYERLCEQVLHILREGLKTSEIETATVSHRAKTVESFLDKIGRKHYHCPLDETEDLAGVRVVCLYDDDRQAISEVCRNSFDVLSCEDRGRELGVDRMGYIGTHLIIRLGDGYRGGVYRNITSLKCEIQIRTVVQDAWAIISHGLAYKKEKDVPENLRRDLNHAAALLEIAQAKFDELKRKDSLTFRISIGIGARMRQRSFHARSILTLSQRTSVGNSRKSSLMTGSPPWLWRTSTETDSRLSQISIRWWNARDQRSRRTETRHRSCSATPRIF